MKIKPNKKSEIELLEEAIKKGDKKAYYNLGWCYLFGSNVHKNEIKAVEYFRKGALLKETKCMQALAVCYRDGDGVEIDLEKMIYWFAQGAKLNDSYCIYHLAVSYEEGQGVDINHDKAIELMKRISDQDKEARAFLKKHGAYESKLKRFFKGKQNG